jgi:hypothetical protein
MIFKIQRPLGGHMGECLVYDRGHNHMVMLLYDDGMRRFFESQGNPLKLYVEGTIADSTFDVSGVADDQDPGW